MDRSVAAMGGRLGCGWVVFFCCCFCFSVVVVLVSCYGGFSVRRWWGVDGWVGRRRMG